MNSQAVLAVTAQLDKCTSFAGLAGVALDQLSSCESWVLGVNMEFGTIAIAQVSVRTKSEQMHALHYLLPLMTTGSKKTNEILGVNFSTT